MYLYMCLAEPDDLVSFQENYRDLARGDLVQTDKKTEQIQEETMSNPDMQKAIDRLETVAARLENLAQRAQGSAGAGGSQAAPGEFLF